MKRMFFILMLLLAASLALAACQPAAEEPAAAEFKVCQVTDVGGIDDKSFNATAWKGVEDAVTALGIEGKYLESQQQTDYEVNINAFVEEGCDLIVPVGFLLADAVAAAAEANPEVPFAIVDVNWLSFDNLYGSGFQIDQATFLAGYLAAGMTETGIVGTYGGINIPPVTQFMDGFVLGVELYNATHGTAVTVLGWDIDAQDGLFVGNFESTDDGRTMGESLLDEGADIIMPVAGPVGAGTLAVLEERGAGLLIGVDNDWSADFAYPNKADYILASALKNMDLFVTNSIEMALNGTFAGGNLLGTLENGYVGLAYGSVWADKIPAELQAEIEALIPQIIAGEIATLPSAPAEDAGLPDLDGREVTIAIENAYLPFNYIDPETGEGAGWDYEVWNAICELLNCTPVYVEAAWEGMIQAVADGQFDAAADGITITADRAEIVDFSMGYVAIEQRLLVRIDEDRIESIEDIVNDEELKLGTQTGTTNYETASQFLSEERISAFEQFPFAVQALIAGDIDAVIMDETAGQGYLGENADVLKLVGPSLSSDELGFIYPKGSDLVEPVDAALMELMQNGTLVEINAKFFGPDFDVTYDDLFPPEESTLGTEEDPIIWAVVPSGETERVVAGFEEVAAMIFDQTGLVVTPFVATEYAGVIEAMCSDPVNAHMASLATFSYILAADKGCADAALVSTRFGSAVYNGQIFVRADSGIETLADLAGKTFCRPDPLSTSGWVIPSITLKAAGIDPETDLAQVVDAGSHDASVAGVYNGDCDAGSSYVDARSRIEEDYPDVMDVIKVIEISADIPNDGVQFVVGFDADMQTQIVNALLAIAETEEGLAALDTAYQWGGLEVHDDTFYDLFRQVLDAAGVSAGDF